MPQQQHLYHTPDQTWSPTSWRTKTARQQPFYPDSQPLERVVAELGQLPHLVTFEEVESLKRQLGEAARGERFLLQGGDCAESFADCTPELISNKLKILLQMSLVLVHGLKTPIVRVGRIAGQYAKPRSAANEVRDGLELPNYRGDLINRAPFTNADRTADPTLMLRGYERAALTLNYVRALVQGGFADLHHPENWDLDFVRHSPLAAEYRRIVQSILDSLNFMETISGRAPSGSSRVDFFTSHEGLHLLYEQAQTHYMPRPGRWYNFSTHLPWIGMRTAEIDGAHVEYCRGIANPIGVKVGPRMTSEWLQTLLDILHPDNEPGRLTLIHRFGAGAIEEKLPPLIDTVRRSGKQVLWVCDPMHGNTEATRSGVKTRRFESILKELELAFALHERHASRLGGVHFEMTGEDVTECTGGARGLTEADLQRAYTSQCDPRLNYEQALEMAMRIVGRRIHHVS